MRSRFKILFFFASISSASAGYIATPESQCSSIDLRNEFNLRMRNQGGISWCFAHAAADNLQYLYRIPEQISAADIAIHYADSDLSKVITFFKRLFSKEDRLTPPQTGFIAKAIKKTIPEGYCPESVFPSDFWTQVDSKTGTHSKVEIMDAILDQFSTLKKVHSGEIKNPEGLAAYYTFEHLDRAGYFELLKNSKQNTLLSNLRAKVCAGERKPYPSLPFSSSFRITGKRVFQRINENLGSHLPVSIDFFSGIFDDYDHYKRKVNDLHTVLLYGRKYDPVAKTCVYLMKNSYGDACNRYDPKIKCDAGYLWFPEGKLYPTLTSTLALKRL
jgi:hypothetical protein